MNQLSWFAVRKKSKHLLRSFFYSGLVQKLVCLLISSYIKFVIFSSKKTFHNLELANWLVKNNQPFLAVTWHGRIAISAYTFLESRKFNKNYQISVLASNHGDGAIIGGVMQNLGTSVIYGSTRKNKDSKRGIDIANFRKIFSSLKNNSAVCITPDGPRGPRFKVGGQTANIAKITGVPVIAVSSASSNHKIFNSWDKFILPLPFSRIAFYINDPIYILKDADDEYLLKINKKIENSINEACRKADELVGMKPIN